MTFCALCTSATGPFSREPLGKNDALVAVCRDCSWQPVTTRSGPFLGFVPSGGMLTAREVTAAMRKTQGDERYERDLEMAQRYGMTPAAPISEADRLYYEHWYDSRQNIKTGRAKKNGQYIKKLGGRGVSPRERVAAKPAPAMPEYDPIAALRRMK